jgi:hypothetical protein
MQRDIDGPFRPSNKNPFEEVDEVRSKDAFEAASEAASSFSSLMGANGGIQAQGTRIVEVSVRTTGSLLVFQSTTFRFRREADHDFPARGDISVPLSFHGDVRLWTRNSSNRAVWCTLETMRSWDGPGHLVYQFLSGDFDALVQAVVNRHKTAQLGEYADYYPTFTDDLIPFEDPVLVERIRWELHRGETN